MLAYNIVAIMLMAWFVSCSGQQQYTNRYDNINLDEVLGNRRLLVPYVRCMLDQGRCTAEGKELRSHISDALQTGCTKCTKAQKSGARRVINHLINKEPEYWRQLGTKYDPQSVYVNRYEGDLKAIA